MARTSGCDVLILGGGLFGCFTGLFLARSGLRVTVLERGQIGAQASATNFGALRLHGRSAVQYPLSLRAQQLWEAYRDLTSEDCEIERTGHLYIARSEEGCVRLRREAELAQSFGVTSDILPPATLREQCPYFSDQILLASHSPRSAVANPRLSTPPVARSIVRLGGTVVTGCEIVEAGVIPGGFELVSQDGRRFSAPRLVNAAGAWATVFADRFGEPVPMFSAGPPQFVTEPVRHRIGPSIHLIEGDVIVRQIPRGNIIFSGYPRTHSNPDGTHTFVPPVKTRRGMAALAAAIPMLAPIEVIRVWSGVEGYLPDMLPVISPSRTALGLFHAFGGSGGGFQIAPAVGESMAQLIISDRTTIPLDAYAIDRFEGSSHVSEKIVREFDAPR